jgi:hypothetical protein
MCLSEIDLRLSYTLFMFDIAVLKCVRVMPLHSEKNNVCSLFLYLCVCVCTRVHSNSC